MTFEESINRLKDEFPFSGYVDENQAPYKTVWSVVTKYLQQGDKLFDLGSGPCDKTAIAAYQGVHCTASDDLNDDWHLRDGNVKKIEDFASKTGIDLTRSFKPPKENSLNMVMMNDVLEHIGDSPRDLLIALTNGLKPGGYLFISVPNLANIRKRLSILRGRTNLPNYDLYYWYRGPWRGPKREYVRGDLISMSQNLGLETVEIYTVHHMLKNLKPAFHPLYKAATTIFPDWRDTWVYVGKKPKDWTPKKELSDSDFAHVYEQSGKHGLYK